MKSILKIVPKPVLKMVTTNLNTVINLIPLGLWQLKIEYEDGLINFKILFLKVEKVSGFLTLKSLSYSIQ